MSNQDLRKVAEKARRRLEAQKTKQKRPESINDVFDRCSPELDHPDHLRPYVEQLELAVKKGGIQLCFHAPPQFGKLLSNDTPIETARGWVTVGDVAVGDQLVGSDGGWTEVLEVHPHKTAKLLRVTFGDGTSIIACDDHKWATRGKGCKGWKVRTTGEMYGRERIDGTSKLGGKTFPGTRSRWEIPMVKPVERPEASLPLDPYLLGCWLGDGTARNGAITSMDPEIHEAFGAQFAKTREYHTDSRAWTTGYAGLRDVLREQSLLGNKHVPPEYLNGSVGQRLALLQGLCDTDGTVAKNGSSQSFCTTLEHIKDDFCQLVFSLGGHCTVYGPETKCAVTTNPDGTKSRKPGRPSWRVGFRLPAGMSGFRLQRQIDRLRPSSGRNAPRRRIAKIERVADGPGTCFTVDAPDHLFCAGRSYIVTHNSETSKHALVFYGLARPGLRHAYVTYNSELAITVRNQVRELAVKAGLNPHASGPALHFDGGTVIQFVGRDGGLTGRPIDGILIVDDILKGQKEARSPTIREECWQWALTVAFTRCHPQASKLVMMTRWDPDDLSGRLIDQRQWPYVRLAAECDTPDDPCGREIGESLWEKHRPREWLQQHKASLKTWESMYQGNPRAEGDSLFVQPAWYSELPSGSYRNLHGVDLAYTAKTRSDWSVLLTGRLYADGNLYLTDILRQQVQADVFTPRMASRIAANPGPVLWYGNATERGSAQLIKTTIPSFQFRLATSDKYVRAMPTAEKLWNVGRIHVPQEAQWARTFVSRVEDFTGEPGGADDDVDALAAMGDLALQFTASGGTAELNRQIRQAMHGHLRLVR